MTNEPIHLVQENRQSNGQLTEHKPKKSVRQNKLNKRLRREVGRVIHDY